jgi:hypothetical protein
VAVTNGTVVKGVTHNLLYRKQCCQHSILCFPGHMTVPFVAVTFSRISCANASPALE